MCFSHILGDVLFDDVLFYYRFNMMGFDFQQNFIIWVLGFPWNLVGIVSELVYNLYTGRKHPTYIGVVIHLLSTMDIAV